LQVVAETAYVSGFSCSRLPDVSAYCALGGVSSGVNTGAAHRLQDPSMPVPSVRRPELKGLSVRLSNSEDRLSELARKKVPARLASLIRKLGL
jgi:hypothetical protein